MSEWNHELSLARRASRQACELIYSAFSGDVDVQQKQDASLVTAVDRDSERIIIDILRKESEHAVLSEETDSIPGTTGYTWVIDPIDGTTNFSRKHTPFAVSIALMKNHESLVGVIENPLTNECFHAQKGGGTFSNDSRIVVAENDRPAHSILFFNYGSSTKSRHLIVKVVDRLIDSFDLRTWGTTAWELCAVAKGTADGFICVGDKLWDYAAGMLLVQEAGGLFTNWRGGPWSAEDSFVLASNPKIHPILLEYLSGLQPVTETNP